MKTKKTKKTKNTNIVAVMLESEPDKGFYAYCIEKPTIDEATKKVIKKLARVDCNDLSPTWDDDGEVDLEESPNALSKHAGLKRYYITYAA